jgi:hypothetical protein
MTRPNLSEPGTEVLEFRPIEIERYGSLGMKEITISRERSL